MKSILAMIGAMLFLCSCVGGGKDVVHSIKSEDPYNSVLGETVVGENSFEAMIADDPENDDFLAAEADEPEWLENINRFTFGMNDSIYKYALDPISAWYTWLMPDVLQEGISNFSYNILGAPERFFAALGQAKFEIAGMELGRTLVNAGALLGTLPSVDIGEIPDDEDFGQMFASWGVSEGYFVVAPLMGPTTTRDAAGTVLSSRINPVSFVGDFETVLTVGGVDMINGYEEEIAPYNALKKNATDKYSAIKSAYLQSRRNKIKK